MESNEYEIMEEVNWWKKIVLFIELEWIDESPKNIHRMRQWWTQNNCHDELRFDCSYQSSIWYEMRTINYTRCIRRRVWPHNRYTECSRILFVRIIISLKFVFVFVFVLLDLWDSGKCKNVCLYESKLANCICIINVWLPLFILIRVWYSIHSIYSYRMFKTVMKRLWAKAPHSDLFLSICSEAEYLTTSLIIDCRA